MELAIQQQIFDQFTKATKLLIAIPKHAHADVVSSGLGMRLFLKKMGKEVDIICAGEIPGAVRFLPEIDAIQQGLTEAQTLVLTVDTTTKELDEISYQVEKGSVKIYVKPKDGMFSETDVSFATDKFPYDVIVLLGCKSLEDLGKIFEQHAGVFFDTPKINIDNQASNEYFGAVNLIDINATSVAEILTALFANFETQLVDEDIATCLLTGIIAKTHSFQHVHTTPNAFLRASELVGFGGRQQEVIKHLYKTKSLSLLRLWGRALARLKTEKEESLAYSILNLGDFGKAGASDDDLAMVLKELIENMSGYKLIGLISEVMGGEVRVLLAVHPQISSQQLQAQFAPRSVREFAIGSYNALDMRLADVTFADAEARFTQTIKKSSTQLPVRSS